jgi:hypothetical protein
VNLRVRGEELRCDVEERGSGSGDFQIIQKDGGDEFVDENPAVLRVVAEFYNVPLAVIRL